MPENIEAVEEMAPASGCAEHANRSRHEHAIVGGQGSDFVERLGNTRNQKRRRCLRPDDMRRWRTAARRAELDELAPIADAKLREIFLLLRHVGLYQPQRDAWD